MAKKPSPFDLYALDPKAKRAIEAENRFKADLKTKNKFAARPQTGATISAPRRGGVERTADRLAAFGVPMSVTEAIKDVDRNLLGFDETAQSIRNIQTGDAGAGDYLNVALAAPVVGGVIAKPAELAVGKLGRGAMKLGRKALDTRAGRYLTEALPVLDNADDAVEAAFRVVPGGETAQRRITNQRPRVQGLPAPEARPALPAPGPRIPAPLISEIRDAGLGQKMHMTPQGAYLTVMENAKYAPRQHSVTDFVVPEELRGQGLGSALLDEVLQKYAPDSLSAAISSEPSARAFYKRGFRPLSNPEGSLEDALAIMREDSSVTMGVPKQRITFPDESQWELPNLDEEVEITTLPTPAIVSSLQKQVTGWHGSPTKFAAERKLISPTGETSFAVGQPNVLPNAPAGFSVERDYPLGRFRSDFVNTGEGAQQYSIGTYLAENPDVARNYRSELTRDMSEPTIGGLALSEAYDRLQRQADRSSNPQALYDRLAVLEDLAHDTDTFGIRQRAKLGSYSPEARQWFEKHVAPKYDAPGALYKVRANVDPRELLDWDAPLANQTEAIRRAAEGLDLSHLPSGNRSRVMMERFLNRDEQPSYPLTGQMFLSALPHTPEGNYSKEASDYLLKFGVPGVKYWDEGSREMGKGTRNFVIYDPERDLDILERYAHGGLAVKRTKR